MVHKTLSPKSNHICVVFELPIGTWADRISLVGDFNDWDAAATLFVQEQDGIWRAEVDLPTHTQHKFHYLFDGDWHTEYHADGWSENKGGIPSSIVEATISQGKEYQH